MSQAKIITAVTAAVYVGAIVLANYLIVHGFPGATPTPFGTYTVPVGFGLVAPAGVYLAAVSFPARDLLQRSGGRIIGLVAILVGAGISWWVSSPAIAVASGVTFLCSETLDFAVYTPLAKRYFIAAVVASGVAASALDSWLFLKIAGLPMSQFAGLFIGKLWIVTLVGGPIAYTLRKKLLNAAALAA